LSSSVCRHSRQITYKKKPCLFGLGRKQGDDAGGKQGGRDVVDDRRGVLEDEEAGADDEEEEEDVVVEDGQIRRFKVRHFVGLPQNPLVFFLLRHLLVVRQSAHHVRRHRTFATTSRAVLEDVLRLLVSKGNQDGGDDGGDSIDDSSLHVSWIQLMNAPEQPDRQCGDDEGVSVEEGSGFGRESSAEILQQQLFLVRQFIPLRHDEFGRSCVN